MQTHVKKKTPCKKPAAEKACKHGEVVAAVTRRQTPSGYPYSSISLYRTWTTQQGKQMTSDEFFEHNEADLVKAIADACSYIQGKRQSAENRAENGAAGASTEKFI